jgi:heat shock protein HslJ
MTRAYLKPLALAALMASTWTAEASVAGDADAGLEATKWQLVTIGHQAITTDVPTLRLGADGALSGSTGCNVLKSTYSVDGPALTFGPIGTTRKYCRAVWETERAFLAVLGKVRGFAVDGNTLILSGGNGETLAAFKPAE